MTQIRLVLHRELTKIIELDFFEKKTVPTNEVHSSYVYVLMVFTVTSSDCKVKKARFYEFSFTLG